MKFKEKDKSNLNFGCLLFFSLLFILQNQQIGYSSPLDTLKRDSSKSIFLNIRSIKISGNKKTHNSIITRELNIRMGDSISILKVDSILTWNSQRIFNTRLFNKTKVSISNDSGRFRDLIVEVEERWYIFPIPLISFGDRNPNEWLRQRGADIRRLNFGINLELKNFTGRNDELNITFQEGFTQNYGLFYSLPYVNKKQRAGLIIGATFDTNKEVAYKTGKDTLVFFKSNQQMRNRFNASASFSWRPKYFDTHLFDLDYNLNHIADTIALLNPNYFGGGRTKQSFFAFRYTFTNDTRDIKAYAQKGRVVKLEAEKLGLTPWEDIDLLILRASYAEYFKLGRNFFFATLAKGKTSFPASQPYLYAKGLGYIQDFVRGYEYYVIDGPHFILNRNTLRKKLWGTEIKFGKIIPIKQFRNVPLDIYLNTYADWGIVFNSNYPEENKRFMNAPLFGYGLGIDIVTYYDQVLRLEYSFNKYGESGFYFHFRKDI